MTLKELIDSEPDNSSKTDAEVLAWLNEGSGEYRELLVNARQLMNRFGAQPAADFLDKLDAVNNNVVKWAMKFMVSEGIDVGNAQTRTMLVQLAAANVITNTERDAIKGLATELKRYETINLRLAPKIYHVAEARQ